MMSDLILSPSSINLFISEPALWVMKQFYGIRGPGSIYTMRGKLVESIVNRHFECQKKGSCFTTYAKEFAQESFDIPDEITEEDIDSIFSMGQRVYKDMKSLFGTPVAMQSDVSVCINGTLVSGYIDYDFGDFTLDLKTANKVPHKLVKGPRAGCLPVSKSANVRQQVIYEKAIRKPARLMFCSPNKDVESFVYEVNDKDRQEQELVISDAVANMSQCHTEGKVFAVENYKPKNMSSFFWDDNTRAEAIKIWS